MRKILLIGLLWPAPLFAMDGRAFEAEVSGHTFHFESGGKAYGEEQYLPGKRVVWRFEGGPCRYGRWFTAAAERICFVYEHDPEPQCWHFRLKKGRLQALFDNKEAGQELLEQSRSKTPLNCPNPDLNA